MSCIRQKKGLTSLPYQFLNPNNAELRFYLPKIEQVIKSAVSCSISDNKNCVINQSDKRRQISNCFKCLLIFFVSSPVLLAQLTLTSVDRQWLVDDSNFLNGYNKE